MLLVPDFNLIGGVRGGVGGLGVAGVVGWVGFGGVWGHLGCGVSFPGAVGRGVFWAGCVFRVGWRTGLSFYGVWTL